MAKPIPGAVPAVFFTRRAKVVSVIDGDTVSVDVDCGFHVWVRMSCRIAHVDAPEKNTIAGQAAKAFLMQMLPPGTDLVVDSITIDKYGGRFDAKVWKVETGENIADALIKTGNAKPWVMGKQKKPYAL
jgi:endonuclease YncB( thermonuclease family)